jgi:dipeptidyl aminopeptidase/acylaminoacyl peptidase
MEYLRKDKGNQNLNIFACMTLFVLCSITLAFAGSSPLSPEDVLKLRQVSDVQLSPDGKWIAYTVLRPRSADEEPGFMCRELFVVSLDTGEIRPFITGDVSVSDPRWSPDGSSIAFLSRRGNSQTTQVWHIPFSGGEAVQLTHSKTSVSHYRWAPSGKKIAYLAMTPRTEREKTLSSKGYEFIFYEENLKHRNLYTVDLGDSEDDSNTEQITKGITVWDFEFSPEGRIIAASVSPKNLIDHRYMFRQIHLIDLNTKELRLLTDNPGKLGNYAFSPDSSKIVYGRALERKDHAVSQAFVVDIGSGKRTNLTIPKFKGHIQWVGWKNNDTAVYLAGEGVWNTLSTVQASGGKRTVILHSRDSGVVFSAPSYTRDFSTFAMRGHTPGSPGELYVWRQNSDMKKLTDHNPWLADRILGHQEVIQYAARDSLPIEGILVYPLNYQKGKRYPLIVVVHGGPEAHYTNGWVTSSYSHPAQVLAGKGYVVFLPNYRASTGYGVEFGLEGYEDPAGKEFDDIADGIDFLVERGIADPDRVGLGGGSYGGFAAAWFSTYYTKYVKAVIAFVGITDLISRRGTLDIPYEELYVHSGKKLEEMWEISLKRSPIYYAHQSKTAVLIMGGTNDTRVHPSQSLELYRRLKMTDHPAVRLVQYPGEGHGNAKQPGRIDYLYRHLQWYDWYVRDAKPLDGPMPPLDISDSYGLELPER